MPGLTAITARVREEDHHAYLRLDYEDGYSVTSSGLANGILRILALTILPYLPQPPGNLITEEPENGLHPQAMEAVLQSLGSLYDGQVWISSHSPVVLAHTTPAHLLSMRRQRDGSVEVVRGDRHPRLKEWREGMDLGTLFAAGVLD